MTEDKNYTLRGLTAEDVFPMFKIISGIGIKEFKSCFESEKVRELIKCIEKDAEVKDAEVKDAEVKDAEVKDADASTVGIMVAVDIASIVFANLPKCKDDIYQFLSGLSGISKKEIALLPMNVFFGMIIDVIRKEEFKDFFQVVARLFK